jgi:acyl carrier protein
MVDARVLSFGEFQQFLSDTLSITASALTPDASFLNDLAVDSLKLVDLMLQFERQLGLSIPTEAAWEINTVGEAYDYYINEPKNVPA